MSWYHNFAHKASGFLSFGLDDPLPGWAHPLLHLILVLAPVLLGLTLLYLSIRAAFSYRRHTRAFPSAKTTEISRPWLGQNLFRLVLTTSKKQQFWLFVLSLITMPILYLALELPKQIVNNALTSEQSLVTVYGFELSQTSFLLWLSGLYLLVILLLGLNKYCLNVYKGRVTERFLRRLRLLIYRQWRMDRSPNRPSEIIPILGQEVEPIGGYAADVLTVLIVQGGTLATILLFMFVQDPILGAAALTVLPIQLLLLPRLQRYLNRLSRNRIREMRSLGRIVGNQFRGDVKSLADIRDVSHSLKQLELIRHRIHRLKFFIKALNNFLTSLTPFLFYSLGGYFVIEDRISLGALIAVLAAHKDFSGPVKELFRYYQQLEDTRIRYLEICRFFD